MTTDSVDVDLELAEFRVVAEEMTEMLLEFFCKTKAVRIFPGKKPSEIEDLLSEPLPMKPQDPVEIIKEIRRKIVPNNILLGSPQSSAL